MTEREQLLQQFRQFLAKRANNRLSLEEKRALLDFELPLDTKTGRPKEFAVLSFWDDMAGKYESIPTIEQRVACLEQILDHAAPVPGDNVLSVGCGSGLYEFFLAKHVEPKAYYTLLDMSGKMMERAREVKVLEDVANVRLLTGSAVHLNVRSVHMDKIYCLNTLEYMPRWESALNEIARVLAPQPQSRFLALYNAFPANDFSRESFLKHARKAGLALLGEETVEAPNFLGETGTIHSAVFKPAKTLE